MLRNEVREGLAVQVYAMGCWYDGHVVKCGPKRATVEYTSGAGITRQKAVPYDHLLPAGTTETRRKARNPAHVDRCPDCGEVGERKGHQTCQYPQD